MTKFLRWKYSAGMRGCSAVRIRWTNALVINTERTNVPTHHTLVHPTLGPMESPSMTAITAIESDQLPIQSISLNSRRARAFFSASSWSRPRRFGNTIDTTQKATTMRINWNQKSARQPKAAMIGAPSDTPMTGPPAPHETPPAHGLHTLLASEDRVDQGTRC